jgi:hypothetical protein
LNQRGRTRMLGGVGRVPGNGHPYPISCVFSYSYSASRYSYSYSYSKWPSVAIRPIGPQVPENRLDQRSASPRFKQPSSTSTVRRGGLSTASLSTSTTKSDAKHERKDHRRRGVALGGMPQAPGRLVRPVAQLHQLAGGCVVKWGWWK